jgi:hypothetical protein
MNAQELIAKRIKFLDLATRLIQFMLQQGYGPTGGDLFRDPRCPYGSEVSLHKEKLAIDIHLYKRENGLWKYLDKTKDHEVFGIWWEAQDPECAWGGHFSDGNHYSLKHEGRK